MFLEPNDASTLKTCGNVKRMLKAYQGALDTIDKVDHLQPNDHLI
jgi:hypothetical protein